MTNSNKTLRQKLFEVTNTKYQQPQSLLTIQSTPKSTPMTSLEKLQAENEKRRAKINEDLDNLDTKKTIRGIAGVVGGGFLYHGANLKMQQYTGKASVKGNQVTDLGRGVINKTGYRRFKPV